MTAFRPEVLTPERAQAWRLAARQLRSGGLPAQQLALATLADAGYSAVEAARIVRTMIAQASM